jgi:secreted PhoX family phosphatase
MGLFNFFSKEKKETLDRGLSKTKESVFGKITRAIAGKSKVDDQVLDDLEEILITSDVGVETTLNIIARIEKRAASDKYLNVQELNTILREEIASLLMENNSVDTDSFDISSKIRPYVIMVVGVNGVGKTTTIGKLAYQFKQRGKSVKPNGKTNVKKHYAMGRGTWEMAKVMSDAKTAFFGDDGTQVGLYMYVGDGEKELDSGTLYAAVWKQINEDGAKDGGQATLSWIKLGHASSEEVWRWKENLTFDDIFESLAPKEFDPQKHEGFKAIKAGHSEVEYLKLKSGMERAAAFLETRRYAAYLGATTEFNKMEGVAFNKEDKKLYIAMSYIEKGMLKDERFSKDDIRVAKNRCGGTYELALSDGIHDRDGEMIKSDFVPTSMHVPTALLGEEIATDLFGNTCAVNKIANTDNLFYSSRARTLFIGEDSGAHVNNYVWAYNIDTKKLSRILSVPAGAEATGLQVVENLNGHAYIMSNAQHQGDFIKTMDKVLQIKVAPKIDKFQAPVGYIYGIPGL